MRILFDQGTPVPLRQYLKAHEIVTAYEMGWAQRSNGDLLNAAEGEFDLLPTTDKNLQYQQNLTGRKLAILVLPTTSWLVIEQHVTNVSSAISSMIAGEYRELVFDKPKP